VRDKKGGSKCGRGGEINWKEIRPTGFGCSKLFFLVLCWFCFFLGWVFVFLILTSCASILTAPIREVEKTNAKRKQMGGGRRKFPVKILLSINKVFKENPRYRESRKIRGSCVRESAFGKKEMLN